MTTYTCSHQTPLGAITASAEDSAVTGLWFDGQKYFPRAAGEWEVAPDYPVFARLRAWLDAYFEGEDPPIDFALAPQGSAFRQRVWSILREIPYGQTTSYGAIARQLAADRGSRGDQGGQGSRNDEGGRSRQGDESIGGGRSDGGGQGKRVVAAQAVGGAVGHNPISLVIPCHRVLGATGSLTGYAGGLEKKAALLKLEGILA
jgi:methylated-DNA-[protein]-cysteine S-methyltransferase